MRPIKTIQKELATRKELAESNLEDYQKTFILNKIKDLEKELEEAMKSEVKSQKKVGSKNPSKSTKSTKKTKNKPLPSGKAGMGKDKKFVMVGDKKVTEDDPNFCDALIDQYNARTEARKKAAGKYKTKSVIQRAAGDVADAVSKGINSIKATDIKNDPKAAIKKMEKLETAGREFLTALKDILGEKITQKEIEEEFGGLEKTIQGISKKYLDNQ